MKVVKFPNASVFQTILNKNRIFKKMFLLFFLFYRELELGHFTNYNMLFSFLGLTFTIFEDLGQMTSYSGRSHSFICMQHPQNHQNLKQKFKLSRSVFFFFNFRTLHTRQCAQLFTHLYATSLRVTSNIFTRLFSQLLQAFLHDFQ